MTASTPNRAAWFASVAVTAAIAAGAGYALATWRTHRMGGADAAPAAAASAPAATASGPRTVLYWYDPMKPEARFDKPGPSPFMDMDLVPRYADEVATGVKVDPRLSQSLGLRLAVVEQTALTPAVSAVGTLGYNDRDVAIVQTRSAGFVERVYARAVGDVVAAGAPLADLLVPEWAGAQQEYLAVRATGEAALTAASRQRLLLMGMPAAVVEAVERSGKPQAVSTVTSPVGGVIQELMVRSGMSLGAGMTLARINGLATLWLEVAVPEVNAALLAVGRPVRVALVAYPGETLEGRIAAVLPEINRDSRTLRVRIELPNRGGRLKAGMAAQVAIQGPAAQALTVPSEAVIRTGQRALVYVVGEIAGQYVPVEVELGREVGGRLEVLKGLKAGQQVVASGQFLVDSEASMGARAPSEPAAPASAALPASGATK